MDSHGSLRRMLGELLAALALFGLIGIVLVVERQGLRLPSAADDTGLIDEDSWYVLKNENAGIIGDKAHTALIVYDAADADSCGLKDNISFVLHSLFVRTDCVEVTRGEDLPADPDEGDNEEGDEENKEGPSLTSDNREETVPEGETSPDTPEEEGSPSGLPGEETSDFDRSDLDTDIPEPDSADDLSSSGRPVRRAMEIDFADYQDLVICLSDLTTFNVDMEALAHWVEDGGHLLFACTADSNEALPQWYTLMGITDTEAVPVSLAESLLFRTDLLAGAKGMEFSDDVISCSVLAPKLDRDCIVHAVTPSEDELPLLWEHPYGEGRVIVCNADIMGSKVDRGIAAASYCRFYPAFAYPVINAAVYCIDDCPSPAPAGYENNVLTQYGYTVTDFIANVWMPSIQELAEKHGIRFSTFLIQSYENNVTGPFTNWDDRESASYYANLILNAGGEIGLHGYNHQPLIFSSYHLDEENSGYTPWENIRDMILSLKAAIEYGQSLADDLSIESYVAPSNVISPEALQEMLAQLEDIRVYAGVYSGTPDQFIQEYSVLENGTVFCPRLTADMQMEDSEWWTQINELNYHYIESNFIHPDDILDEDRSDGGDFTQMLNGYREMIEWNERQGLRVMTISEAGGAVQRYTNLSVAQEWDDNTLTIHATGLIDEAYMMLRTNGKRPVAVSEGAFMELAEGVYIVRITSETTVITLVDRQ